MGAGGRARIIPGMSVPLERHHEAAAASTDLKELDVAAFAASYVVDPRLAAHVPGFDAPFQQAGLAGFSDAAMRSVARELGCPFAVTEALLDRYVAEGSYDCHVEGLFPAYGQPGMPADRPLAVQLIGAAPETMAAAAERLVVLTAPDGPAPGAMQALDVNFACPVKKVKGKRRGGHWLADPVGAIEILAAVREVVPPQIATTVKLRRGTDDSTAARDRFEQVFDAAYGLGYAWATVHARTVDQGYVGPSRWSFLADLSTAYPNHLILGSGDVWSVHDGFRMLAETRVAAVSVARGCIGIPWFFHQARTLLAGRPIARPTIAEQREVLLRHFELAQGVHGEQKASLTMRKFGVRFAVHHPDCASVRHGLSRVRSAEAWRSVVDAHYPPVAAVSRH